VWGGGPQGGPRPAWHAAQRAIPHSACTWPVCACREEETKGGERRGQIDLASPRGAHILAVRHSPFELHCVPCMHVACVWVQGGGDEGSGAQGTH